MLRSHIRAMGRALDVVWYDLGVTKVQGLVVDSYDNNTNQNRDSAPNPYERLHLIYLLHISNGRVASYIWNYSKRISY